MKIGIDIDDTICDNFNIILPYICKYYGYNIKDFENLYSKDDMIISKLPDYDKFARKYYPKLIPNLPLLNDVKEVIDKLKVNNEIIFITSRSTLGFDNSYKISYDYLKKNEIYFDKLIVGATNKYEICKENKIDIFIDNSIYNCSCVSKNSNIDVLLFSNKYNKDCNNFKSVKSWQEIYDYISNKYLI